MMTKTVETHRQVTPITYNNESIKVVLGFEVFTAVAMKSNIFWDMTPCSPLSYNRRYRGEFCLPPA
jgi:hypothetical protein